MTEFNVRENAHQTVVRSSIVWTPIFVGATALAVLFAILALDSPGAWVSFAIAALIGLLSGVSALGALRDLYAEPIETRGVVERKWRKSDVLVFRGHYILCQRRVFRLPREIYQELPEVGGRVILRHYPHTNALVEWAKPTAPAVEEEEETGPTREWTPAEGSALEQGHEPAPPSLPPPPARETTEVVEPPRFAPTRRDEPAEPDDR